jgi:hypothetical protein
MPCKPALMSRRSPGVAKCGRMHKTPASRADFASHAATAARHRIMPAAALIRANAQHRFIIMIAFWRPLAVSLLLSPLLAHGASAQLMKPALPPSKDNLGRTCLAKVVGEPQPVRTSSVGLIQHVVRIQNVCLGKINVRVCYRNTEQCKTVTVNGRSWGEVILGFMPKVTTFQFDYDEVAK